MTKREKLLMGIIYALVAVILIGLTFFASEIGNCNAEGQSGLLKEHKLITATEYMDLLKGDATQVVFIGRPTCPYSNQQDPILQEIAKEYDIVINYLNIDEQPQTDMAEVLKTYASFTDGQGVSTPTMVIIKNKKVFDVVEGLLNKSEMVNYLKANGIIE